MTVPHGKLHLKHLPLLEDPEDAYGGNGHEGKDYKP